jgi:hypothetical protein
MTDEIKARFSWLFLLAAIVKVPRRESVYALIDSTVIRMTYLEERSCFSMIKLKGRPLVCDLSRDIHGES